MAIADHITVRKAKLSGTICIIKSGCSVQKKKKKEKEKKKKRDYNMIEMLKIH